MPKLILVTGFEAFNGFDINPSELLMRHIETTNYSTENIIVCAKTLSVEFLKCESEIQSLIRELNPSAIISFGLGLYSEILCVEQKAKNIDIGSDNAGNIRNGEYIIEHGPDFYLSTLPIDDIVATAKKMGIPAKKSDDAGAYVCNHLFYYTSHIAFTLKSFINGFIHIPPLIDDAVKHNIEIDGCTFHDIIKAFEVVLKVVRHHIDEK